MRPLPRRRMVSCTDAIRLLGPLRGETRLTLPDTSPARVVAETLQGKRYDVNIAENFSALAWRKLLQNAVACRNINSLNKQTRIPFCPKDSSLH